METSEIRNEQMVIVYAYGEEVFKGKWENASVALKDMLETSYTVNWYLLADCEDFDIIVIVG